MKINVQGLLNDASEDVIKGLLNPEDPVLAEIFSEEVRVDLKTSRYEHNIDAHLEIKTVAHFKCDRCLVEYQIPIVETAHMFFQVIEAGAATEFDNEDDVFVLRVDKKEYDLDPIVLENLSLTIPIKKLCKPNCKGLCPHCGSDLNVNPCDCVNQDVDPRLDGLRKFLK